MTDADKASRLAGTPHRVLPLPQGRSTSTMVRPPCSSLMPERAVSRQFEHAWWHHRWSSAELSPRR